jgi:PAS domain S-box-containing protein
VTAATDVAVGRMQQDALLRILLIEDDQNDAELLHACLAEAVRGGAEIVHAASLAKGLRVLESQTIHITVLDLDLPDSVGLPTLEKAGSAARGPVIVVTGNPHPALVPEALKRGAYEVLKKSELDARALMRIVRLASIQSQTERSLRLTERRYRALIENSREAIGLFGSRGELLYGNPAMRKLLWSGNNLIDLVHPFERDSLQGEYARLVAAPEGRVTRKAHFRYHDGSWRMLEAALRNRLQDGDVAAVVANFTDVSSQVDLEERFRATFDQAAVGIAHVAHDGRFQLVNRKLCEMLGYSREELAALTVFDLSHAEDRDVTVTLRRKMRAREIDFFSAIKRYLRKDGSPVWVEVNVSLVRTADGSPSYEIALFEDISLRRQAEEALQRSERRFRALIENSSDGILLADGEGRMLYASPGARRVLGYASGETLGWQIADLVHPAERCALDGIVAAARAQRGETQPLRLRARHKDRGYRLLEGTCTDLRADDSVRAMVFNFRDITEREDAQARVRDSEARFRSLAELSSDWYWEQDAELRFTWGSPGAEEHGEIPQAALEARQPFRDFEYLRSEPDGERRYVSISGEPVLDEAGNFIGYRGTARDITERKRSELRMERLKTMYEALSSANEAILRAKSTEEMLARACEIAVESGDFLLGTVFLLDPASGLLHRAAASGPIAGETETLPASIHASQSGGQGLIGLACRTGQPALSNDYPADPRIDQARRAVRPYFIGSAAVYPLVVEGELAGVFGLQHAEKGAFTGELTALLQRLADNISFALENLQREERYRTVVNSANEGILVYDRALNIVAANAAAERIIGVPAREMIGKPGFTSLFACVREDGSPLPAEDRPARLTARTGRGMTGYVLGIVREDRSVTWLSVNTAFLRRADEQHSYGVVSTLSDITARRAAELALRESEERFRNLTELSTDWYWEQDEQLRFTRLYGGVFARLGIDPEALRGKLRWELADVDTNTAEWQAHRGGRGGSQAVRGFA